MSVSLAQSAILQPILSQLGKVIHGLYGVWLQVVKWPQEKNPPLAIISPLRYTVSSIIHLVRPARTSSDDVATRTWCCTSTEGTRESRNGGSEYRVVGGLNRFYELFKLFSTVVLDSVNMYPVALTHIVLMLPSAGENLELPHRPSFSSTRSLQTVVRTDWMRPY